jgi:hypothetical protein
MWKYAERWITELSTEPEKARAHRLIALLVEIADSASG